MIAILLAGLVLAQPTVPSTTPPSSPSPAAQPETSAGKAAPTPLAEAALANLTDRLIGRGVGAYYTAQRFMEWIVEANPTDADAVKQLREEWDREAKPGHDALIKLMASRKHTDEETVLKGLPPLMDKSLAAMKAKLKQSDFHEMITERRLDVRTQPADAAAFWYMFDPARRGDDMTLVSAGKVRKVQAQLFAEGGKEAGVDFTVPLSWNVMRERPGQFSVSENAGLGPLLITLLCTPIAPGVEADPMKLVAGAAAAPDEPDPKVTATTFLGRPAGRASKLQVTPSGKERVCGLYEFTVAVNGGKMVAVMVTVGASSKPGECDYTREELAAYAEQRRAVIDAVLGSMKAVDLPVKEPAKAEPAIAPAK